MIAALRINTDFTTEILDLEEDTLGKLQGAVGGWVQAVDLHDDLTLQIPGDGTDWSKTTNRRFRGSIYYRMGINLL